LSLPKLFLAPDLILASSTHKETQYKMRGFASSLSLVLAVATIAVAVPSVADPQPVPNIAAPLTPNGADSSTPLKEVVSINRQALDPDSVDCVGLGSPCNPQIKECCEGFCFGVPEIVSVLRPFVTRCCY